MNETKLKRALSTQILGNNITYYHQTDSTNTQAKIHCTEHSVQEGDIFIAGSQNKGKGTDGNSWSSREGNLSLSVTFNYDSKVNTLFPLYPAVALAKSLRENYNIDAHVKWPNDILVGNKKISGILCEGVAGKYMIVGIGINVNGINFPESLLNIATSMKLEKSKDYILEEVFANFITMYENLLFNSTDIRQEWLNHTKMLGKMINITQNGTTSTVKIDGLSPEGFLQIVNSLGESETLIARSGLDISTEF